MKNKTRFAVVGCGTISEAHLKSIEHVPEAELVAVCDIKPTLAEEKGKLYGVNAYSSLEELLKQDNIDVVNICTPSSLHPEQTKLAAKAGKHVFVEKPMAIQIKDVEDMIQVCKENHVHLATVFPRRMSPQANYARELIQSGKLGKLSLCSAYMKIYRSQEYYDSAGWRGTWEYDGGGAMMNQGIHTIDLLQWLAGPVSSLYGKSRTLLRDIEVEDTAASLLEFEHGAIGVMEMTTTAHINETVRIEILGENGTLIYINDEITTLKMNGQDIELPEFESFSVFPDGHRIQIQDMAQAVREGRKPMITGEDGKHSLDLILGTYESSRENKELHFN
ncbi:Gfo/Idh/MocA family protein [Pontibacillus sp. HMF3514]|uniref:Gfo/Idh/MocA family protein n=1 Tax=Pontibacillus sp. HMF3514 TaxID=2692425 RepID=UPI00132008B2|nr:Gfo/Idh/MocA family oxidoreductase [Pontibacillus sp. HMF3514]QHE53033.1 Gfo/Idh/MocA family oxidoreductase [Pontibacillus sp. HMF3514]